ncbi:hypothetical protein B0H14DRAFT_3874464 [Mycena olivaceomarginata]|nr:hypothetical protein B0H14DRAFT_3874464 [Mycena olivaceomarginata]
MSRLSIPSPMNCECAFAAFYAHDLCALMRVNRAFHSLIEPMLYSKMELHRPGYHEHYQYPDAISSGERRNYHENDAGDYPEDTTWQDSRYTAQAFDFLKVFENPDGDNIQPSKACRSLGHDCQLPNIEHLELTVGWPYDYKDWDSAAQAFASMDHPPLDKLRTVRLRGYLPKEFVRYVCQGDGYHRLELALLDRPIGSSNANERKNPPPGWKDIESEVDGDAWLDGENEDTASDKDSDAEDYENEECVAPRALPTLLDSGIDLAAHFSYLSRLTLRRPAESLNPGLDMQGVYVSLKSDLAILSEWAPSFAPPAALSSTSFSTSAPLPRKLRQTPLATLSSSSITPTGQDTSACGVLPPALLEENRRMAEKHSSPIKPQKLGLQVEARFKPLGVDVRSGLGRRMLYEDDDGVVRSRGDGLGGRVEEDDE